jgi:hypothetical protein
MSARGVLLAVAGLVGGALLLALAACSHRATSTGPRPWTIPAGCDVDQSGEFALEGSPDWRYLGTDDGGTLVLSVTRSLADGGEALPEPAADGGVLIVLQRGAGGFSGATHASAWPAAGVSCPVAFPTEVKACSEDRLVLSAVESLSLDETCREASSEERTQRELRLVRTAQPADAGR